MLFSLTFVGIIYVFLYPSPMMIEITFIAGVLYASPYTLILLQLYEAKKEGRNLTFEDVGLAFLLTAPFMAMAITALLIQMNPILRDILLVYGCAGALPTLLLITWILDQLRIP